MPSLHPVIGLGVLIIAVLAASCSEDPKPPPPVDDDRYVPPALQTTERAAIPFTDVTAASGLEFQHETGAFAHADGKASRFLPECMGPGLALFDANGDGKLDIYAANGTKFPGRPEAEDPATGKLFLNRGELRFEDVTAQAGLALPMMGMGAAAADYDADGDEDLLVLTWGGPRLFRCESNSPTPRYIDVTREAGLETPTWRDAQGNEGPDWSISAVFFDADGDLDLDLFVVNYVRWCPDNDVFESIDGTNKSFAIPKRYEGHTCRLFRQTEPGRFEDATKALGFETTKAKSMGVALWDFNHDGRLDLVVANDTQPNFLYLSTEEGLYRDGANDANIAFDENGRTRAGMGIDAAQYAFDGTVGIPIGNFTNEPVSLFREDDTGFFTDVGQRAGLASSTHISLTFGLTWIDADLDGLLDLVLANGHIEPLVQTVQAAVPYEQRPQLLHQFEPGRFLDATDRAGSAFESASVARGLARGDLDGDGDEDLVFAINGGGLRLFRNDHFSGERPARDILALTVIGRGPNRAGIGTIIDLEFAGGSKRRLIVRGGSSYASQSALLPIVGLSRLGRATKATVRWPDGKQQVLDAAALAADRVTLTWPQ